MDIQESSYMGESKVQEHTSCDKRYGFQLSNDGIKLRRLNQATN